MKRMLRSKRKEVKTVKIGFRLTPTDAARFRKYVKSRGYQSQNACFESLVRRM